MNELCRAADALTSVAVVVAGCILNEVGEAGPESKVIYEPIT